MSGLGLSKSITAWLERERRGMRWTDGGGVVARVGAGEVTGAEGEVGAPGAEMEGPVMRWWSERMSRERTCTTQNKQLKVGV